MITRDAARARLLIALLLSVVSACSAKRRVCKSAVAEPATIKPSLCADEGTAAPLAHLDARVRAAIEVTVLNRVRRVPYRGLQGPTAEDVAPPTCGEVQAVKTLRLEVVGSLRGLELLTSLEQLAFVDVADGSLTPLVALTLKGLRIGTEPDEIDRSQRSSIGDWSALAKLVALERLQIAGARLKDLTPLLKLRRLRELTLANNGIENVRPLAGLHQLRELNLAYNQIDDLSGLRRLKSLRVLTLAGNRIVSARALSGLTRLERLDLTQNPLKTLAGFETLSALQWLNLSLTDVSSLEPLVELPRLRELHIWSTPIIYHASRSNKPWLDRLRENNVAVYYPGALACRG